MLKTYSNANIWTISVGFLTQYIKVKVKTCVSFRAVENINKLI